MTRTLVSHRGVFLVAALALLVVGFLPLLRANAAARQQAWEADCTRTGGAVWTGPPAQRNPLVVQSGHVVQECRAADGRLVSRRD